MRRPDARMINASGDFTLDNGVLDMRLTPLPDVVIEQQRSGTSSDESIAAANIWYNRNINAIVRNTIGATLAGNTFTLPPGTYYMEGFGAYKYSSSNGGAAAVVRLQNITDGVTVGLGMEGNCVNYIHQICDATTPVPVVITATKTFALQHLVTSGGNAAANSNIGGVAYSVMARVKIWKIA